GEIGPESGDDFVGAGPPGPAEGRPEDKLNPAPTGVRGTPMDLIIRNANLPDGRAGIDIGVEDRRLVAVGPKLAGTSPRETEATGRLVSPPFVDAHFHMDSTLSLGQPRMNVSGTLLEGIQLWGELKPLLTAEAIIERALRYCDWAVARGLLAIRSHVDT